MSRVAVPTQAELKGIPAIPTRSAPDAPEDADDPERFEALWQANRAVAEAYDLTAADLAAILATFPVFARKRPAFHAYLLDRLAEWQAESP